MVNAGAPPLFVRLQNNAPHNLNNALLNLNNRPQR